MKRGFWIAKGVKILVIVAVVLGIVSFLVMSLWNWLVPGLFGGPVIDYWEALGLLVLARLLFGGLRPHGRGPWGHAWRHRMREQWEHMTPEERERFRSRFRDCGGWHGRGGHEGGKNGGNA
jgi:hypothetical protein